jgi:hypothetical protein
MQKALEMLFIAVLLVIALNRNSSSLLCAILAPFTGRGRIRPVHWICPNALNATAVVDKRGRIVCVLAAGRLFME